MKICELTKEQFTELKQNYLMQHFDEVENRSPSYGELADVDNIIPDSVIYDNYGHFDFTEDDFFCSKEV